VDFWYVAVGGVAEITSVVHRACAGGASDNGKWVEVSLTMRASNRHFHRILTGRGRGYGLMMRVLYQRYILHGSFGLSLLLIRDVGSSSGVTKRIHSEGTNHES